MRQILIFAITVIAFGISIASVSKKIIYNNEMATKLLNKLADSHGPGIQYVVVNKDSIVYEQCVGLADIEAKKPMNLNNTMAAFSMTKTLTAIAVLQLIEQHKIGLDDEVSDYIDHPYDSAITVRQLLTHKSGIPNPIPLKFVHLAVNHDDFDEEIAITQVLNKNPDLDAPAGSKYKYSNIGYWLLGKLIEKVSGEKYSDYVTENIFEPLTLTPEEIGFLIPDENNHAKGYLKKWSFMNLFGRSLIDNNVLGDYEESWLHIKNVYVNGPAFGGAIGNAIAFSKILQDLLSEKSKLLGEKSKQLLYSQQKTNTGESIAMTLAWHIGKLNNETYYYKEGGGAGFHCEMRIYPEQGIASVIMSNRTSFHSRKILSDLDTNFVGY